MNTTSSGAQVSYHLAPAPRRALRPISNSCASGSGVCQTGHKAVSIQDLLDISI